MATKSNELHELLEKLNLLKIEQQLSNMGVEDVNDFDYLQPEDWNSLNLTKIEKNKLGAHLSSETSSAPQAPITATNEPIKPEENVEIISKYGPNEVTINYLIWINITPNQGQVKVNLDTTTYEDLLRAISTQEQLGDGIIVELFTAEGYPLASDSFNYQKTLKEWYFEDKTLVLAIPRKEIMMTEQSLPALDPNNGDIQIFIKHQKSIVIRITLGQDTGKTIRQKIYSKTNIPTPCIKLSYAGALIRSSDTKLSSYGIQVNSTLQMWTYGVAWSSSWRNNFTNKVCIPQVEQSIDSITTFNSTLYCVAMKLCKGKEDDIKKVLGHLRRLTCCPPLIASLHKLFKNESLSFPHKVAIQEILYLLFKQLLTSAASVPIDVSKEDKNVLISSPSFWGFILSEVKDTDKATEEYKTVDLICSISNLRVEDPVIIPGCNEIFDRQSILDCIENEEEIPGCTITDINESHLHSDLYRKKLLLSFSSDNAVVWNGKCNLEDIIKDFNLPTLSCNWNELASKRKGIKYLEIVTPLQLKTNSTQVYVLTQNAAKRNVVYVEREACASTSKDFVLFDPETGDTDNIDPDQLAANLFGTRLPTNFAYGGGSDERIDLSAIKLQDPIVTRRPDEAIVVLIDISGSMSATWSESITRLNAVKQLFHAFANRTMAYNLFHVVGLTVFSTDVSCISKVTELFEQFKDYVDALYTTNSTALYDAIDSGITQLVEFTTTHPMAKSAKTIKATPPASAPSGFFGKMLQSFSSGATANPPVPTAATSNSEVKPVRRRIICLTDGQDNASKKSALQVTQRCLREEIIVDSFVIGTANEKIKAISHATSGCCFHPNDIPSALKLFEMESVLSLHSRKIKYTTEDFSQAQFDALLNGAYDINPETILPQELDSKVISAKAFLAKQSKASIPTSSTNPLRLKRIMTELAKMQKEPHFNIEIYPSEDDISFWRLLVVGPEFTPYENCVFLLYVRFQSNYPLSPPEVRFVTPIYHCNINSSGRICHSVFGRNYSSDLTVKEILDCVYGLLLEPEPNDPLDSNLAEQYFSEREAYNEKAKRLAQEKASKTLAAWRKELLGIVPTDSEIGQIPKDLICSLCGDIFTDPVITPYGNTFERMAIENHLQKNETDPKADQPLKIEQLVPNDQIREKLRLHREANIVPEGWWDNPTTSTS